MWIIPTNFEVDMTTHCRVIAFLSADTSRDLVTLTFDLLILNSCHTWRVTCPTLPPCLKTLCLSVLDLWVITFPVGYYWKCARGHSACAESRDPWAGCQKQLHFWNLRPRFAYSLCNFSGCTIKIIKVICENYARTALKTYEFLRMREITWFVKDALNVLLPSFSSTSTYNIELEHIVAFTAIFSNICTAHAQKWLFMNFRCKFRHRRSIARLRMSAIFLLPVCWPTHLESIPHASTPRR